MNYPRPMCPVRTSPTTPSCVLRATAVRRYAADASELAGKVFFSGRLADFKYYDMDQAVSHALHAFANEVAVHATAGTAAMDTLAPARSGPSPLAFEGSGHPTTRRGTIGPTAASARGMGPLSAHRADGAPFP